MVAAVSHRQYLDMGVAGLAERLNPGSLFADVKGAFNPQTVAAAGLTLWRL